MGLTRKWRNLVLAALSSVVVLGAVLWLAAGRIEQGVREVALESLGRRLDSTITLDSIHVTFFPRLMVTGEGLVVVHNGSGEYPPLIRIKEFVAEGGLSVWRVKSWHANVVQLTGLEIHIPPRKEGVPGGAPNPKTKPSLFDIPVVVDSLVAADAYLEVIPRDSRKEPLAFPIQNLQVWSLGSDQPASFHADLINPKPRGTIYTIGVLGPWNAGEPSETAVTGTYQLRNADLGTLRGIQGTLTGEGNYSGEIDDIHTIGKASVPNFALDKVGHELPLEANFDAIVDGVNGDVLLNKVDAMLGKSPIKGSGAIVGHPGVKGRFIDLDMSARNARMEDMLTLATRAKPPPMTGVTNLHATMELEPGGGTILDRLTLSGTFGVGAVKFTKESIESKVNELSRRGQGKPEELDLTTNVSNLKGTFTLRHAVANFQNLSFTVTGASVQLAGLYDLRAETLDFSGTLRMQAKLSQTVTGVKSFLLKAVDPFFSKKGAGTVLPIKITGTRAHPDFTLNLHR
jgi:hypothetical protein